MAPHPYSSLPDHCFWRQSIETPLFYEVDPVVRAKFKFRQSDRVATAGSCFAQNIGRYLGELGFCHFVTETAHPMVPDPVAAAFGYGFYPARFGNIYTSTQLLQLLKRAYGSFVPAEDIWPRGDGRFIDPFRPRIQPDGFASAEEYAADRRQHFAAVRKMVEEMDVFIFTLGLTEGWVSSEDGAAFPLCPGVAGGEFDAHRHRFVNLRVSEIVAEMREAFNFIRSRNASVRFIVTVSPVPLVATAEDRSVLVSTTYSKSALRVVCEELAAEYDDVDYFPAYEIVSGNYARGYFFAEDLRSVTQEGVFRVMRLFFEHYTNLLDDAAPTFPIDDEADRKTAIRDQLTAMENAASILCDEEALMR